MPHLSATTLSVWDPSGWTFEPFFLRFFSLSFVLRVVLNLRMSEMVEARKFQSIYEPYQYTYFVLSLLAFSRLFDLYYAIDFTVFLQREW